jgi:hypothetical protein
MKRKDSFHNDGDRYILDFGECSVSKGFAQVDTDQDAWYFGTWANPKTLRVVQYAEGDLSILDFDNKTEFAQWLWDMAAAEYFKGIDGMLNDELIKGFRALGLGRLLH